MSRRLTRHEVEEYLERPAEVELEVEEGMGRERERWISRADEPAIARLACVLGIHWVRIEA